MGVGVGAHGLFAKFTARKSQPFFSCIIGSVDFVIVLNKTLIHLCLIMYKRNLDSMIHMADTTNIQALRRRCNRLERYSWGNLILNYAHEFKNGMQCEADLPARKLIYATLKPTLTPTYIEFRYDHPFDPPVITSKESGDCYVILNGNEELTLFRGDKQSPHVIKGNDVGVITSPTTGKTYVTIKGRNEITLFIDAINGHNLDYTCTTRETTADANK